MAATFRENRAQIQGILEQKLATAVPKLCSVGLITKEDRDLALDHTVDDSTRAANLYEAIESNLVTYQDLLIFVYALLSSSHHAQREFIKSLVFLPKYVSGNSRRQSFSGTEKPASTVDLEHHRRFSFHVITSKSAITTDAHLSSAGRSTNENEIKDEATEATHITLPTQQGGTKSETVISPQQEEEGATDTPSPRFDKKASVWYRNAHEFPGIKFSNFYTKQRITFSGGIIKGEGIELQIPGRAIEKGHPVEFIVQGCIDGPFDFPDDVNLASPVFLITPHYEFQRAVTTFVDSTFLYPQFHKYYKHVVFLTSPAKPHIDRDGLHWKFMINENTTPQFIRSGKLPRLMVQVTQFCLFCFGLRRSGEY